MFSNIFRVISVAKSTGPVFYLTLNRHEQVAWNFIMTMYRKSHEEMQLHVLPHLREGLAGVLLAVADAGLVSSIRARSITGCPNVKTESKKLMTPKMEGKCSDIILMAYKH